MPEPKRLTGRWPQPTLRAVQESELAGMTDLPGYDIVARGLVDLAAGHVTRDALLIAIAAPRFRADGIDVPGNLPSHAKDRLWELLQDEVGDDVHATYNALVGRVLSFLDAYEAVRRADRRSARAG